MTFALLFLLTGSVLGPAKALVLNLAATRQSYHNPIRAEQ